MRGVFIASSAPQGHDVSLEAKRLARVSDGFEVAVKTWGPLLRVTPVI